MLPRVRVHEMLPHSFPTGLGFYMLVGEPEAHPGLPNRGAGQ